MPEAERPPSRERRDATGRGERVARTGEAPRPQWQGLFREPPPLPEEEAD